MNEKEFCTCDYERSQRSFWYSVVKPTLDKLGKLTADDETEEALSGWDKTLSKYLTELVKEGQLTEDEVKNNQYSPKKKGIDRWMKLTGGIDGKEKGLELDALTPDRIRQIFTDNLREYIDSTEYYEHDKQVYLVGKIRDELDGYIDAIVNEV